MAFVLAPLFPSVFFLFALHLANVRAVEFMLIFSIPFSYLPCWLFGVPLIRILEKMNFLSITSLTVAGALLGVLVFYAFGYVFSLVLGSIPKTMPKIGGIISGAVLGALVAGIFSLIAGLPLWKGNST